MWGMPHGNNASEKSCGPNPRLYCTETDRAAIYIENTGILNCFWWSFSTVHALTGLDAN
jgi:hypothetical protein